MAKKGDWVQIHSIVLRPGERAAGVPEDTAKAPLEMWVKGYLVSDAAMGITLRLSQERAGAQAACWWTRLHILTMALAF